jgi:hypothetical protein
MRIFVAVCFIVTQKSYNVVTRTSGQRRAKTRQNSQRSEAGTAVLLTLNRAIKGVKAFRGRLEACNVVTVALQRTVFVRNCLCVHIPIKVKILVCFMQVPSSLIHAVVV